MDYVGAFLLVTTLVLMLVGLNAGGYVVPWSHPLVCATLPPSVALLSVCGWFESMVAKEPMIPTKLLLHRTILFACLANWLVSVARFGLLFYVPIFL